MPTPLPHMFERSDASPPVIHRIPPEVVRALTPAQRDALFAVLTPPPNAHRIDMRASIAFFGRRYYVTLLAGRERRSLDRLAREGQLDAGKLLAVYAVLASAILGPFLFILAMSATVSRLAGADGLEPPLLALHELFYRP